jgi:hypothetical protein
VELSDQRRSRVDHGTAKASEDVLAGALHAAWKLRVEKNNISLTVELASILQANSTRHSGVLATIRFVP